MKTKHTPNENMVAEAIDVILTSGALIYDNDGMLTDGGVMAIAKAAIAEMEPQLDMMAEMAEALEEVRIRMYDSMPLMGDVREDVEEALTKYNKMMGVE